MALMMVEPTLEPVSSKAAVVEQALVEPDANAGVIKLLVTK